MPLIIPTRRALLYKPPVAAGGGSTLYTNLISFWELSESSGTRADSVVGSANDLTDNNTVTGGNDGVDYSQFTRANSEYLSRADNASLSIGGSTSFSVNAWVYLDTTNTEAICSKMGAFGQNEFILSQAFSGSNIFRFQIYNSAHNSDTVDIAGVTTTTWTMVTAICELGGNISIAVNGGTPATLTKTRTVNDSTSAFQIGAANGASFWDGRIRRVGLWKKALIGTEVTALYNGGSGLNYSGMA